MWFVVVIGGSLFLFGLVQWARSGAVLWNLWNYIKKNPHAEFVISGKNQPRLGPRKEESPETDSVRKVVREMESMIDGFLLSSFKVLGALAICVWLFVIASVVLDVLEIDWLSNMRFASSSFWGNPAARSRNVTTGSGGAPGSRSNFLRQLRSSP